MDEARVACAIDISGRGLCAFEVPLPPGATGTFDHELLEEFAGRSRSMRSRPSTSPPSAARTRTT